MATIIRTSENSVIKSVYAFYNKRWYITDYEGVTRSLPSKFTKEDVLDWWENVALKVNKSFYDCELKFDNPNK